MHLAQGKRNNIKIERAQFIIPQQIGKYRFPFLVFGSTCMCVLELKKGLDLLEKVFNFYFISIWNMKSVLINKHKKIIQINMNAIRDTQCSILSYSGSWLLNSDFSFLAIFYLLYATSLTR